MKKKFLTDKLFVFGLSLSCTCMACSSSTPKAMEEVEPIVKIQQLPNGNFEQMLSNWTVDGDGSAVSIGDDGCDGSKSLVFTSSSAGTLSVSQSIKNLEDGYYDLEFYAKNQDGNHTFYVDANGRKTAAEVSANEWKKCFVRGIEVKDGQLTVALIQTSTEPGKSEIDGLKLICRDGDQVFLKGGDISLLSYVEQNGGIYYDNGQADDCLEILKNNGMNIVRLRLYNDPGNKDYSPSDEMPAGIEDETDILQLAKRAKEKGMQILLTFHYSDYWTNGKDQNIPHQWEGLNAAQLKEELYVYTKSFMEKMAAQGTTPEYVAIGNEIQAGLLYPYGACDSVKNMCSFFQAGCEAVKAVAPESKVIIHLDAAGNKDRYNWFLGLLKDYNVSYDIIGASYYPFYTNLSATSVCQWTDYVTDKFDKDLIFMETAYAWNPTLADNTVGQIGNNNPYDDMTKAGQKRFMLELSNQIKNVNNQRVLGYMYWDPIFINVPGIGWKLGQKNPINNTTLFDFQGNALQVFDALKYNN